MRESAEKCRYPRNRSSRVGNPSWRKKIGRKIFLPEAMITVRGQDHFHKFHASSYSWSQTKVRFQLRGDYLPIWPFGILEVCKVWFLILEDFFLPGPSFHSKKAKECNFLRSFWPLWVNGKLFTGVTEKGG